jgi:hypothetical protein
MISFSNINKQYGKQLLFVDASFQLNPGKQVGRSQWGGPLRYHRHSLGKKPVKRRRVGFLRSFTQLPA